MKRFFILLLLFCASHVQANDTLTRAQVYNFNVGDTFDYRMYSHQWCGQPYPSDSISISYSRFAITNIYYSQDSSVKYIQRKQEYPPPVFFDTLVLTNLTQFEVVLDYSSCRNAWGTSGDTISINMHSSFNGRITNLFTQTVCPDYLSGEEVCADGLGITLNTISGGVQSCSEVESTELVYYVKEQEVWGTPYYDFPSAVYPLNTTNEQISLFPTVNNGTFNLKIANYNSATYQLTVYDLTGREMHRTTLNNSINDIELPHASPGMYLWNVTSQGTVLQSGKMVVN